MENRPLLTIAIPTYNGAKTIHVMMDILLAQYDPRIELIVSDNCSTDGTSDIIKEYQEKYPYIKHVKNEKNIGADANFLQCMRLANGIYTYLLSDDDVLAEGALAKILNYLEKHQDVGLIYLDTFGFRGTYRGIDKCERMTVAIEPKRDIFTKDKKEFMKYAFPYWGFITSFITLTDNFRKIVNPEHYFGTYWLQSYIHVLCCKGDCNVGVISGKIVGAGVYVDINNFDSGVINGQNYKQMLKFAVEEGGFDRNQLRDLFVWRYVFLSSHAIIKEKAAGIKKTHYLNVFKNSYMYPSAWIKLYPTFFLPKWLCRIGINYYRKKKNMGGEVTLMRQGDSKS